MHPCGFGFYFFFYKLFSDIFRHISYLDIFTFLKIYSEPEESNLNHVQKFIIHEHSLILKFKNLISIKTNMYPNVYLNVHI